MGDECHDELLSWQAGNKARYKAHGARLKGSADFADFHGLKN
jgi:hypothetical protein